MATSIPKQLDQWDFLKGKVQDLGSNGDFLSSESVVICSGPPQEPGKDYANVIPIGLTQNIQVNQSKQIQQLFEIGSREPYFVPGRTLVQAGLSRILFDGSSLLKAVYLRSDGSDIGVPQEKAGTPDFEGTYVANDKDEPGEGFGATSVDAPGIPDSGSDFYINLASGFFNQPLGLAFIMKDKDGENYGGFYLENCYVQTHSISLAGQQTVLIENVGMRCSRVVPIRYIV